MSKEKQVFGEALANYSLAFIAGVVVTAVLGTLSVFVLPSVTEMLLALGSDLIALGSGFAGILFYMAFSLTQDRYDIDTGLEVFAAFIPLVISPILGVIIGYYLEKFG